MKTNTWMLLLAGFVLAVGVAACNGGDDKDKPVFEDPSATAVRKDRMGRPAINTVIRKVVDTDGSSSDAFNATHPESDDAAFGPALPVIVALLHACPPATLGSALLPDVITIDTSVPSGYLNGRDLDDDVIDLTLLSIYSSNGGVSYCSGTSPAILTDHIDANDVAFGATFPYLAAPH